MQFRDLKIGQHFRNVGAHPSTHPKKKVSSRCFVYPQKKNTRVTRRGKITGVKYHAYVGRTGLGRYCYTSKYGLDTDVVPTGRTSPLKKRKGRGRGPATLGSIRRRR